MKRQTQFLSIPPRIDQNFERSSYMQNGKIINQGKFDISMKRFIGNIHKYPLN